MTTSTASTAGRKPIYAHPVMEEVLAETYGVMVYQEQIMRILNRLGGIELASAYACIKAISKKKYDIIDARKVDFVKGAQERGLAKADGGGNLRPDRQVRRLRLQQVPHRRLRPVRLPDGVPQAPLHRRVHGGAAVQRDRRRQQARHHGRAHRRRQEARRRGAAAGRQPQRDRLHRRRRQDRLRPGRHQGLRPRRRRGASSAPARRAGAFQDLFDFCERIDHKAVPAARHREAHQGRGVRLPRRPPRPAHARPDRAPSRPPASARTTSARASAASSTATSRPSPTASAATAETLPEVEPWPETEKLKYEKEVLDFYLSSHPLAQREAEIRRYVSHGIGDLKGVPADTEVTLGGMLTQVRVMTYKKPQRNGNTRYGRCKIEDFGGHHRVGHVGRRVQQVQGRLRRGPGRHRPGQARAQDRRADPPGRRACSRWSRPSRRWRASCTCCSSSDRHRPSTSTCWRRSSRRRRGRARSCSRSRTATEALHPAARPRLPRQPRDLPPRRTRGTARLRRGAVEVSRSPTVTPPSPCGGRAGFEALTRSATWNFSSVARMASALSVQMSRSLWSSECDGIFVLGSLPSMAPSTSSMMARTEISFAGRAACSPPWGL